jgi:hypothetical protein
VTVARRIGWRKLLHKEITQLCQLELSTAKRHFLFLNAFVFSKFFATFSKVYFKSSKCKISIPNNVLTDDYCFHKS